VNRLYVFLRSDLDSMTPGKAAAQVAHAASQAAYKHYGSGNGTPVHWPYREWENSPWDGATEIDRDEDLLGFGTTIVLDAGHMRNGVPRDKLDRLGYVHGVVRDPSYPLRDGTFTHYVNIFTCFWLFGDPDVDPNLREFLDGFELYSGNNK
jgi:hypothetical protein